MKNSQFERELRRLNPEQRRAVETIEGPVMVLAGPGTGKTQVVALRIAQILQQTQLNAQNVLALTFTEAGVTALKARLQSLIGEDAYRVTVATFHGFARQVIETFPYVFALHRPLRQLGELERYLLLEEIAAKESLSALQPLRSPRYYIQEISRAIQLCKQESVTPVELRQLAEDEYQVIVRTKLTKVAAVAAKSMLERRTELAQILERYQEELTQRALYDYEDLILSVTEALQENIDVRSYFQERYQYLLVDEYQDTNNSQNALVAALADFFSNPNLFVVGDDKQAIFRFQGASVANLLHFHRRYPDITVVSLVENYRSSPEILTLAGQLITHNQHQITEYLPNLSTALQPNRPTAGQPQLVKLSTPLAERQFIQEALERAQADGQDWSELAVLTRTNTSARQLRQFLLKAGLPVASTESRNLLATPEIAALLRLLTAIADPLNNQAVVAALLLLAHPDERLPILEFIRQSPARRSLLAQLKRQAQPELIKLAERLIDWQARSNTATLDDFLAAVFQESGLIEATKNAPERLSGLELYGALWQLAIDFSQTHPNATLTDWLKELELAEYYGVVTPIARLTPQQSGIFVGTFHSAKGLEFRTVILSGVDEKSWNLRRSRSLITLPAAITGLENWHENEIEDERRLFYVGLTRAKEQLLCTYSATTPSGQSALPCQFIAEIGNSFEAIEPTSSAEVAETAVLTELSPIQSSHLHDQELVFLRERIQSAAFSFSDWRAYQICPRQYLLNRVLRLPTPPNPSIEYGNAVHKALELFFREFKTRKKLPTVERLQEHFNQALTATVTANDLDRFALLGQAALAGYYRKLAGDWVMPVGIEYSFSAHQVRLGELWITGKFDRIDPLDPVARLVRVVDYKTAATPKSRNVIEGKTKNSDGDYKKQLTFYALLAKTDRLFPYRVKDFEISFIDDDQKFTQERFEITSAEIKTLSEEIKTVHQEILNQTAFPHTRDTFDRGCELCAAFPSLFG